MKKLIVVLMLILVMTFTVFANGDDTGDVGVVQNEAQAIIKIDIDENDDYVRMRRVETADIVKHNLEQNPRISLKYIGEGDPWVRIYAQDYRHYVDMLLQPGTTIRMEDNEPGDDCEYNFVVDKLSVFNHGTKLIVSYFVIPVEEDYQRRKKPIMRKITINDIEAFGGYIRLSYLEYKGLKEFIVEWADDNFNVYVNSKSLINNKYNLKIDDGGIEYEEDKFILNIGLLNNNLMVAKVLDRKYDEISYYIIEE